MKLEINAVILTYNEELHLERCIQSVKNVTESILIVDSYSDDKTLDIAKAEEVLVIQNRFQSHGDQRRFALSQFTDCQWVLFVDADEYLDDELINSLKSLKQEEGIVGYEICRKFFWYGKQIVYGGYYPLYLMRLFKVGSAVVDRDINEHIVVDGNRSRLMGHIIDENLSGIDQWIKKHNNYSRREAESFISQVDIDSWSRFTLLWRTYVPLKLQPFLFFLYRYVIRGGFRDGTHGFWYHYLHSFCMVGLISVKKWCYERR